MSRSRAIGIDLGTSNSAARPRAAAVLRATGSPMAPAYYVMFGVTVGLIAAFFIRDRTHDASIQ